MYKIGDKILYGASGVMTVVDIREEMFGDTARSYYVLCPTLSRSESLTFVPTDSEILVSAMRSLMTRDEIDKFLKEAKNVSAVEWIEASRQRADAFKRIMESGDRLKMISMIRAIDENALRREAEGKKNFIADENAKQKALKLLYSEISVVLGIPEEDAINIVKPYLTR